jgi:TetR/AcrR family transcriptional regulator
MFDRISEDKRQRVLFCAKRSFAENGYSGANVNEIAKDAGISVGALYKYFRSKDDIFLAIISASRELIESTIDSILASNPTFLARVEAILRAAADSSAADPDIVKIYIACTTQELAPLARELATQIESPAAEKYRGMIASARASGEIDPPCDDDAAAFCLDDIFLALQFSFGSPYYRHRLETFVGEEAAADGESLVASLLGFVRAAFRSS